MPTLLSFLGPEHSWATQTSAGDFMKAIITVSANASQNEQACIGPNELTRQLVSKPCVERLIDYMLGGGNPLTVGVGIIIEVIRKNNSDYDPDVGPDNNAAPSSRDPIYLGTLLRRFADRIPDFMTLIMNTKSEKQRIASTFSDNIEPLGFDRFKTCELMAELLHCSNMALLNEVGSEQVIALRDQERKRLRAEGKLIPARTEEAQSSADDLTMRGRHSSADDGRRLEVTNASDDDGFEEVTPSGDMTEDTSHEFVKAEDEVPPGPTSSFLDKDDDDDFVDEPLSSPRLHVQDAKVNDLPDMENPELVVAPLSPRKVAVQADTSADDKTKPEELGEADESIGSTDEGSVVSESSESTSRDEAPEKSIDADISSGSTASDKLEGELESALSDLEAITKTEVPGISSVETPKSEETSLSRQSDNAPSDARLDSFELEATPAADQGEGSIIVGHDSTQAAQPMTVDVTDPVVGDYLKLQFVEHKVVPTILSFFFRYPWNNFLHNVVYDIVQQVFNGPMDRSFNPTLAVSLFESADVTNAIINGQNRSEESQAKSKTRMGYMGHLTLIAEEVVKFTERNPPELLSELVLDRVMSQDWINYVEGALAETRERDNAILGGVRPEVAMSNRAAMAGNNLGMALNQIGLGNTQGSSLADAGLNGGAEDNGSASSYGGAFSIGGGGGLGGSGSDFDRNSSDEDEDSEENEEDPVSDVSVPPSGLNPLVLARVQACHCPSYDPAPSLVTTQALCFPPCY